MTGTLGLQTIDRATGDVVQDGDVEIKIENAIVPFYGGSIPANPTRWIKWAAVRIPWACDIVGASAWAAGVATGGSVDFYDAGATLLTGPINVQGQTHNVGTMVADPSMAQNAELALMVLAEGNINRLEVIVVVAVD